uniref:Ig-like domain-containing protein n=1 Tax=Oreochromis aureus TaxID=47969 RepID=A0AAZ1XNM5_OREAU
MLYTHFSECALFFAVGLSETKHVLYLTPGNDVVMPCDNVADTCSRIIWAYNIYESETIIMVHNGIVEKNSAQAARLSLHSNCSLSIKNITAEDAGHYLCRPEGNTDQDTTVHLNILTSEYLDFHVLPYIHICDILPVRCVSMCVCALPKAGARSLAVHLNKRLLHSNRYTCVCYTIYQQEKIRPLLGGV